MVKFGAVESMLVLRNLIFEHVSFLPKSIICQLILILDRLLILRRHIFFLLVLLSNILEFLLVLLD